MIFSKIEILKEKNINYNSKKIKSTIDIVNYVASIENLEHLINEKIVIVCLNNKNIITAYMDIAKGNSNNCNLDIKSMFRALLGVNCNKFILVHNHPSGDPTPSSQDYLTTKELKKKAEFLGFEMLDHVIVGENKNFCSCFDKN